MRRTVPPKPHTKRMVSRLSRQCSQLAPRPRPSRQPCTRRTMAHGYPIGLCAWATRLQRCLDRITCPSSARKVRPPIGGGTGFSEYYQKKMYLISILFENWPTNAAGQRSRWNSENGKFCVSHIFRRLGPGCMKKAVGRLEKIFFA